MAHAIIWLLQAAQDLQGISDYISAQSQAYADLMIERILDAVEDLEKFPSMGSRVTAVRHQGVQLRQLLVGPYRVIYRLKYDRIIILGVIHGARDLRKAMRGRWLE